MHQATCSDQSVILSSEPAEQKHRRLAAATVLVSLLIFVAAAPFAHVALPTVWPFMPIYQSALVINDLITAIILLSQFSILRMQGLLVLACGYLFTAILAPVHLLTFPGLFSETGLLGAGPQTTAWLYMAWHAAFPLTVCAYALADRNTESRTRSRSSSFFPILTGVVAVLALAYWVTLIATVGHQLLPGIMRNNGYTATMKAVVATVWLLSGVAVVLLWRRRRQTALDIWLIVVMCSWVFDVGLSAVFNGGRFDLGFYVGRLYGLLSSMFVLTVLLLEMGEMYRRLSESLEVEQEERKHEAEERRRVFETSVDLILITDRHGNFTRVSPSCAAILGYAPEEMIGHSAVEFMHRDDLDATRNEMRSARKGRENRNFETRYIAKEGHVVTLACTGVWSEPEQKHFFIARDMTEAKKAEAKLRHLAHYDQLTDLPNRFSLQNDLEQLIDPDIVRRMGHTAIAMIDLDGFKDINDTLGHSAGDELLKAVTQRLRAVAADRARVYRLGGDEFVAVFAGCGDPRVVADVVEKTLAALFERFEVHGQSLFIGASAGIAIAPADGSNVEDLLANVDLALYEAKAQGGRTYRLFLPVLRARAEARRKLDTELRRAFSQNEFELFFQPQIRLVDGVTVGAEALLRWRHPERGLLAPGAFIEALVESPIVRDVGNWILLTACQSSAAWRTRGLPPIRMGVNLFPAQFHHDDLPPCIEEALRQTGLPADALELEITENIGLSDDAKVLSRLSALREKGIHLAFDDFGTGYASLNYLTRYPLSRIKIDQSFVRKIPGSAQDAAVIRSIIVMAHNLGLSVVAEGVETPVQAAILQADGCDEVQGYLYAKPLSFADFAKFLQPDSASLSREPAKPQARIRG